METYNYSEVRASLSSMMEKVCDGHVPIVITRQNASPVVMMSLEDYQQLDETAYLMRSPANAARLMDSVANIQQRKYKAHALDTDE